MECKQEFITINHSRCNDMDSKFPVSIVNHNAGNWNQLKQMVKDTLHQNIIKFYVLKIDSTQNPISKNNVYALIFNKLISRDKIVKLLDNSNTDDFEIRLSDIDLIDNDVMGKPLKYDINRDELRRADKLLLLEQIRNFFGVDCEIESEACILKGGIVEIRNAVEFLKNECPGSVTNDAKRGKKRRLGNDNDSDDENEDALTFEYKGTKVFIYEGDLTKVNADALAISVGPNFEHSVGVAAAVMNLAGPEAHQACINMKSLKPEEVKPINVQLTLPFRHILLTNATSSFTHFASSVANCYKNCIAVAQSGSLKSLSFPLFGCGHAGLPVEDVVKAFLKGLSESNTLLEEIHLVELKTEMYSKLKSCIKVELKADVRACKLPDKGKDAVKFTPSVADMHLEPCVMKNGLNLFFKTGEILEQNSSAIIYPLPYGCDSLVGFPNEIRLFMGTYIYSKSRNILEKMTPFNYEFTTLSDSLTICHFSYPTSDREFTEEKFERALKSILTELDSYNNVSNISFWPFTDKCNNFNLIKSMIKIFDEYPKPQNICQITVLHKERSILQSFHHAIKTFREPPSTVNQTCPICLDTLNKIYSTLPCTHTFCKSCLDEWLKDKGVCPICKAYVAKTIGNQPDGQMNIYEDNNTSLPGFENYGTIIIDYYFPNGVQGPKHLNPGVHYTGTRREAYLPNNSDGQEVLSLLRKAWDEKLLFTIGRSVTTGIDNCVVWNDVHHKTSRFGGPSHFGYPDPTYLNRVKEELRAKGIC